MSQADIRWQQRFNNFRQAFKRLSEAVAYVERQGDVVDGAEDGVSRWGIEDEMLQESLVKRFEFTHELAWRVMKDYAEYQGHFDIRGSRDAVREAFAMGLVDNGELWMEMIACRNRTAHTYDEKTIQEICLLVVESFHPALLEFEAKMAALCVTG